MKRVVLSLLLSLGLLFSCSNETKVVDSGGKLLGVWDKVEEYTIFKGTKIVMDINKELEKEGYYSEFKTLDFRNNILILTYIEHSGSDEKERVYTFTRNWSLLNDSIISEDFVYKYEMKEGGYLKILEYGKYKDGEVEYKYAIFKKRK